MTPNPFLFVVGCPRSGTTLLARIAGAHPRLAMFERESRWLLRFRDERIGVAPDGRVLPGMIEALFQVVPFRELKLDREDLERFLTERSPVDFAGFFSGVYESYARKKGKRLAASKAPGLVRRIPELHELWPDARFVHLVRDGRDVALSMLSWDRTPRLMAGYVSWEADPITTCALR